MQTIRWGLLSTARINRRVIPAIRSSRRGELIAVASRSRENAQAYANLWEIPHAYGDYEALLASDQIDAVYISLPNHLHAEWAIRALEAGKNVLLEKPLALKVGEVDRIIAASHKTGLVCMEAFMYLHHPQTKITWQWVHEGRLGEITLLHSVFDFQMGEQRTRNGELNIRLVKEYGGGCLWDVGVYPLSFSQYLLDTPPISVAGNQWIGPTGVDETFAGQLLYPGGQIAQISASFRSPFNTFMEVIGTQGRLYLTKPFIGLQEGNRLIHKPLQGDPVDIPVPETDLYLGEIENIHAAILDGEPQLISLEKSRDHIRTAVALLESVRTGSIVKI